MAFQLVAKLGLNARGFLTGLATSEKAAAKFTRFIGSSFAGGAAAQAGGFATQSLLSKVFGGAKKVANEIPGVPTISAAANTMQPIVDPLGLKRKLGLVFAAAVAAGSYIAKQGIDAIAEVKDLAEQSDLAAVTVQRLTTAAKNSGLEFTNFQTALAQGANSRQEAVESNQKLRDTYAALGITLEDLQDPTKSTLALMQKAVSLAKDVHTESFRTAFRDAFGKGSEKLIPAVQALEGNLGPVISERAVNAVDRLAKGFDRLGRSIRTALGEFTGQVIAKFQDRLEGPGLLHAIAKVGGALTRGGLRTGATLLNAATGIDLRGAGTAEFIGPPAPPGHFGKLYEDKLGMEAARKAAEERKRIEEQIHQEQLRAMNTEQRRLALLADRAKIMQELAKPTHDARTGQSLSGFDAEERLKQQLELARINADLANLHTPAGNNKSPFEVVMDSLAKIGGFAGPEDRAVKGLLDEIRMHTKATAENTRADQQENNIW